MSRFSAMFPFGAAALVAACSFDGRIEPAELSFDERLAVVQRSPCDSVPVPGPVVPLALTGDSTYENEIHDCQRLVITSAASNTFGPLVGVFPIDAAMGLPADSFTTGRIVATIFNWGDFDEQPQEYAPLGIEAGWHCLWLRMSDSMWQAALTQATHQTCVDPGHNTPAYGALDVHEFNHESEAAGTPPDEIYPPTARWGWDSANDQHYIGIKCGDAWCAIGPGDFEPAENDPLEGPKERSVPGWYDAQHLAVYDDTTDPVNPTLRPGPWGTVYPIEGLGSVSMAQFLSGLKVADIVVDGTGQADGLAYYEDKFLLEVTGSEGTTEVWVSLDSEGGGSSHFESAEGTGPAYLRRIPNVLHAARGAARWRWHDTDESVWYWCDACCDSGSLR